jgi:DNA-binding transcriptional MerR regulator
MAIDTLKVARRLREAGFNEAQAEAVAVAVQEGSEGADLATKGDLALQSVEVRAEIAAQGAELRAEIAAVRSEMREMEQRLIARIESVRAEIVSMRGEIASELLGRMFQMILGAVLVNIVAMAGLMFAFAKLLGH